MNVEATPNLDHALIVSQAIWEKWSSLEQANQEQAWWRKLVEARQQLNQLTKNMGYPNNQQKIIDIAGIFAWTAHQANNNESARFRQHANEPYTLHLYRVANRLVRLGLPVEIVVAGLLHDLNEDAVLDLEINSQKFRLTGAPQTENPVNAQPDRININWLDFIADQFDSSVANYVEALTEPTDQEMNQFNESETIGLVFDWVKKQIRNFQGEISPKEKVKIQKAFAALAKILSKVLFENLSPSCLFIKCADIADNSADYFFRFTQGKQPPLAKILRAVLGMNLAMILGDYLTSLEISQAIAPFLNPNSTIGKLTSPEKIENNAALAQRQSTRPITITASGEPLNNNIIELNHLPPHFISADTRFGWNNGTKPWWLGLINSPNKPQRPIKANKVYLREQDNAASMWLKVLSAFGRESAILTNPKDITLIALIWVDSSQPTLVHSANNPDISTPEAVFFKTKPDLNQQEQQFHLTRLMLFLIYPNLPFQVGQRPILVFDKNNGHLWFLEGKNETLKKSSQRNIELAEKIIQIRKNRKNWQSCLVVI